jgi:transposase
MGNRNLRKLLVVGGHAVLFHRKPHTDPLRMWAKKPDMAPPLAAVEQEHKTAAALVTGAIAEAPTSPVVTKVRQDRR